MDFAFLMEKAKYSELQTHTSNYPKGTQREIIDNSKQNSFDYMKDKSAGTIKSNCSNWIYLLTSDNETAKEFSTRIGKYTISTNRVSTSTRLEQIDYNLSNDKSLIGRELMMPDELMRFKFGEGLFLKARMHPIRAIYLPMDKYGFKIVKTTLPKEPKECVIECFNLDEYRIAKAIKIEEKVDLE